MDNVFINLGDMVSVGQDSVSVFDSNNLISTNDALVGPPGPAGPPGERGEPGRDGVDGQNATITIGTTTTGDAGTNASVVNTGTDTEAVLNFTIPRGAQGIQGVQGDPGVAGADGAAATITVGSVQTVASDYPATVQNSGTSSAAVLDFEIPRGVPGQDGADGADGQAATIAVGTTTTGNPGTNASVSNSGTSSAAVFNFTIPRGADGADGITPSITATASVDNTTGTPSVSVSKSGTDANPSFAFAFQHLKGADGTTPSVSEIALTDYISMNTGYSLADSNAFVFGKICIAHLKVQSTNNFTSSQTTIGQIKTAYKPKAVINSFASLGGGQWSISGTTCYCYVQTNGNIIVKDDMGTGKKWMAITLVYAIN